MRVATSKIIWEVLADLTVYPKLDREALRIRDLIRRDQGRSDRTERIEGLPLEPLLVSALEVPGRHVVQIHVPEDVTQSLGSGDIAPAAPDHHRQLGLVIQLRRRKMMHDVSAGRDDRGGWLREKDRAIRHLGAALRRMLGIVPAHAEDISSGTRNGCEESAFLFRIGNASPGQHLEILGVHETPAVVKDSPDRGPALRPPLDQLEHGRGKANPPLSPLKGQLGLDATKVEDSPVPDRPNPLTAPFLKGNQMHPGSLLDPSQMDNGSHRPSGFCAGSV